MYPSIYPETYVSGDVAAFATQQGEGKGGLRAYADGRVIRVE